MGTVHIATRTAAALLIMHVAGCGESGPPTVGTLVSFEKVCDKAKVTTNDGKTAGYTDKVRVSGTMYYPSSIASVEFKCGLSNTLIERAGVSGK